MEKYTAQARQGHARPGAIFPHLGIIGWALVFGSCAVAPVQPQAQSRVRAIGLVLPRLGGGTVAVSDLRGKPLLVALFTTASLQAPAEAAQLVQLHERYGPRGLQVLGVALEPDSTLLRTYVDVLGLRFPIVLGSAADPRLEAVFGPTQAVPRTILVDARGRIVQDHQGLADFPRVIRGVDRLLQR